MNPYSNMKDMYQHGLKHRIQNQKSLLGHRKETVSNQVVGTIWHLTPTFHACGSFPHSKTIWKINLPMKVWISPLRKQNESLATFMVKEFCYRRQSQEPARSRRVELMQKSLPGNRTRLLPGNIPCYRSTETEERCLVKFTSNYIPVSARQFQFSTL